MIFEKVKGAVHVYIFLNPRYYTRKAIDKPLGLRFFLDCRGNLPLYFTYMKFQLFSCIRSEDFEAIELELIAHRKGVQICC